tara:strand:- start:4500 stop:5048 length:549 start_codon:yes stop_codon:yes gene_type:complete
MATFKLNIAETKTGKTYKKELKDDIADNLIGLNIGESISGDKIDLPGFELQITGGSDDAGFPMRSGILGTRKSLTILKGTGFKGADKGIKKRKTVCGHKINEKIAQVNLKITKEGTKKITDLLGATTTEEAASEESKAEDKKEAPKEEKKEAPKEEPKAEDKKEAPKEEKKETKEEKPEEKK